MDKSTSRIALISGVVYFAQGALGIAGISLPLFLRDLKWSVTEITTLTSLVALPWVLKILYGIFSDCFPLFGYRRKSYLILCSMIAIAGWFLLAWLPPTKAWIFFALLLANFGFAATDVITDGLIVEHSTTMTSPLFQSIAWGARSAGAICSGFLGGWLAANWSPQSVFMLTAVLPFLVLCVGFLTGEQKQKRKPFSTLLVPLRMCLFLLVSSNLKWFNALLVIIALPACFATPFFFHMKETLGFEEQFLGILMSLGWFGALIGSFIYAKWLKKIAVRKILTWAVILNSLNILSVLWIRDVTSAYIIVGIGGVLGCLAILPMMSSAALLTTGSKVEGTMFAILMSVYNLAQITFGFLGGKLFVYTGLSWLIGGSGILVLVGLYFISKLNIKEVAS